MKLDDEIAIGTVLIVAKSTAKAKRVHLLVWSDVAPLCGISYWVGGGKLEPRSRAEFNATPCAKCARAYAGMHALLQDVTVRT